MLREHGLTMTRSFFYWPDFMPEPDADRRGHDRPVRRLPRPARRAGHDAPSPPSSSATCPGENWDPAWRAGRDLYSDVWMVGRQAWFAGEMVRRFGAHPAVAGWLVSNEMPLYGGDRRRHEIVAAWAQLIRDAVRAAGGRQPFSLGDGAWGIEVTGRDNGFRLADAAALVRLPRPARLPDRRRPDPPALRGRAGSASWPALRQAGGPGGVRRQLRLRLRRQRGPLLPAGPAQHPARRRDRLDRLEQHRLRRCPARTRTGTTRSSCTSGSPTRHGTPKADARARCRRSRDARRDRGRPLRRGPTPTPR